MIAHHGECGVLLNHRPYDVDGLELLRTTVNEITDKNGFSIWMPVHARVIGVSQLMKKPFQFIGMTMNVTDDVIALSLVDLC